MKCEYFPAACFLVCAVLFTGCIHSEPAGKAGRDQKPGFGGLPTYTLARLQEDFETFRSIVGQQPRVFTDIPALEEAFSSGYALLRDGMDELQLYRILSPIVAKIECGHTGLNHSMEFENLLNRNGGYFPVLVRMIDGRMYAYECLSGDIPAGSELKLINGMPIRDIIPAMLENIPSDGDNLSKKFYILNHWFSENYFNYVENPDGFKVSFVRPGENAVSEVALKPVPITRLRSAEASRASREPVSDQQYSFSFRDGYAVLSIRSFGFYSSAARYSFRHFLDDFFRQAAERGTTGIILDLRDNWGGDPYCSSHLFSYLLSDPAPYFAPGTPYYPDLTQPLPLREHGFRGDLYTLINGACFSSTGHLCSLLKFHKIGTFIGEETAGSFECTDGSRDAVLPNTKLRFHYSTQSYKTAVTGMDAGRGILPDYPVSLSMDDYLSGRDAAMEFAVGLIGRKSAASES